MVKVMFWAGILFHLCFNLIGAVTKCGYESCPKTKDGFINVHMVPHSHDDVGWLKTVDQLYYGSKSNIQVAGVQYIIDSAISSLLRDPRRRFIYVETAFFWKWWVKQSNFTHNQVQELVNEGRLEFVGGGWSMHDEGVVHYHSMLDQMSLGFRKLKESFGDCGRPRAGWQIDPFGHSRESASMMARFGFDGLLFGRLDEVEKNQRFTDKTAQMIWETSANLDGTDLFTGILHDLYTHPKGFCFDDQCIDEPIIDDRESPEFNADEKVANFLIHINYMRNHYKTSNLLVTMGMDFHFQAAHKNFINIDRLIDSVNALQVNGSKVNLLYSTPSCYFKAVNDEGIQFVKRGDDFFPYASDSHKYWTGYFTSRPSLKYFERKGNNFLQICKQLYTLVSLGGSEVTKLDKMKEAMGVLQHHDAVTGTEKQAVASDYARLLNIGFKNCESITDLALRKLMSKKNLSDTVIDHSSDMLLKSCMLLNISSCDITEANKNFVVTIYNPLSRLVSKSVRLPVSGNGKNVIVYDPTGATQTIQIVPIPESVQKIPGRSSSARVEIVFIAEKLPPLGYRSYYVINNNTSTYDKVEEKVNILNPESFTLKGVKIDQSFWWYTSYRYYSGAYVFRPDGNPNIINQNTTTKSYSGLVVDEIHQVFNDWVSQVVRKYKESNNLEFHWLIGPIPLNGAPGKEIITRYTVNSVDSHETFYTDSNGREMVERVRNKRSSYKLKVDEPIAGNYYPVTTRIMINDSKSHLSVITDRAQGGSSINDKQVELMLHRRIVYDDGYGVGEGLNEEPYGQGLVARGTHYVSLGDPENQSSIDRLLVQEQILSAWTFFTQTTKTLDEWKQAYNMEFFGLKEALPSNVQITTLEPWSENSYLIRLEHIMEKSDTQTELSQSVRVNLTNIFIPFEVTSIEETTLGANLHVKNMSRLIWKKLNENSNSFMKEDKLEEGTTSFRLKPMEIRSFIVKLVFNN